MPFDHLKRTQKKEEEKGSEAIREADPMPVKTEYASAEELKEKGWPIPEWSASHYEEAIMQIMNWQDELDFLLVDYENKGIKRTTFKDNGKMYKDHEMRMRIRELKYLIYAYKNHLRILGATNQEMEEIEMRAREHTF